MLLAPTVCMHRHPLGGRNFESFSEDPLLTGKLAAQYIRGLQSKGVAATIKRKLFPPGAQASIPCAEFGLTQSMGRFCGQ